MIWNISTLLPTLATAAPSSPTSPTSSEAEQTGLSTWLTDPTLIGRAITAIAILIVGIIVVTLISRGVKKVFASRLSRQSGMVAGKLVAYLGYLFIIITVLNLFGVNLSTLLGAAGIGAVAIGFAAQSSLANIISGFFLVAEKPFKVGDQIEVDNLTGEVQGIGLLSLTMTTADNRSIRIPNETLVKKNLINISRHPQRRYDLEVGVAYDESIDHVLRVLGEVAKANELCLDTPEPLLMFVGFGDSALNFKLGAWCKRENYLDLRNSLPRQLKEAFDRENIEIPFPHLTLAKGKAAQ